MFPRGPFVLLALLLSICSIPGYFAYFSYFTNETHNTTPLKFVFTDFSAFLNLFLRPDTKTCDFALCENLPNESFQIKCFNLFRVSISAKTPGSTVREATYTSLDPDVKYFLRAAKSLPTISKRAITFSFFDNTKISFKTSYDLPDDLDKSELPHILVIPPAGLSPGHYLYYWASHHYYVTVEDATTAHIFWLSLPDFSYLRWSVDGFYVADKAISFPSNPSQAYKDCFITKQSSISVNSWKSSELYYLIDDKNLQLDYSSDTVYCAVTGKRDIEPVDVFSLSSLSYDKDQEKMTMKFQAIIMTTVYISPITKDDYDALFLQKQINMNCPTGLAVSPETNFITVYKGFSRQIYLLRRDSIWYIMMYKTSLPYLPATPTPTRTNGNDRTNTTPLSLLSEEARNNITTPQIVFGLMFFAVFSLLMHTIRKRIQRARLQAKRKSKLALKQKKKLRKQLPKKY